MNIFQDIKLILLDLDGTIYLDNTLIGDVKNTLNYIRNKGIKVCYLTNNSSKTSLEYKRKLSALGILEKRDYFYSSLDATIDFLKDNFTDTPVYPVATKKVRKYLVKQGIKISENADVILLTFDTELDYKKIKKVNEKLILNATFIATHPDKVCPSTPVNLVDLGSFLEMFKASASRTPDFIIGKPYTVMAKYLLKKFNLNPNEVLMVGDRLSTDIQFGINSNIHTALVLSGVTSPEDVASSEIKADVTLRDINEITAVL